MKEIIESQEITFPKLVKDNQKQFMNLLSIEFDFGYIQEVDYEFSPSVINVITSEKEYMVRLWDITENLTQQTMTVRYSIFVD